MTSCTTETTMQEDAQAVFEEITDELTALRTAILADDLDNLDFHTTQLRAKLSRLGSLLTKPSPNLMPKLHALRAQVHGTQSLLGSACRTVHALTALYRSFYDTHVQALTEQR